MADPVSWTMIEEGWAVVGTDGAELGRVDQVLGDADADIFHGLSVSPGRLRHGRYLPSEIVGTIYVERVEVGLTQQQFDGLPEYRGSPPSAEALAQTLASLGVDSR